MTNTALLQELEAAHQIIRNALNIMTPEQKTAWWHMNERDGVDGEGITRANERAEVIAKAKRQDDDNVLVERRGRPIEAQSL